MGVFEGVGVDFAGVFGVFGIGGAAVGRGLGFVDAFVAFGVDCVRV